MVCLKICVLLLYILMLPTCSWSYGSWIYNYLCNQCQSPLKLWVRTPLGRGVLDTTSCDKVCQWLAAGWPWFSSGTLVSSTNKTDCHNITEILLKVALNTITLTLYIDTFIHEIYYYEAKKHVKTLYLYCFYIAVDSVVICVLICYSFV